MNFKAMPKARSSSEDIQNYEAKNSKNNKINNVLDGPGNKKKS